MPESIRPGSIWVFCEQTPERINPVALELIGQAAVLSAAVRSGVTAVLVGGDGSAAPALAARGADTVLSVPGPDPASPDELQHTGILTQLIRKYAPSVLLIGATAFGRSLAPRLAARLGTGLTADCTGLEMDPEGGLLRQTRPAFGGNLFATIICPEQRPQIATVRPRVFPVPSPDPSRSAALITESCDPGIPAFEWLERLAAENTEDIGSADVLVAVGRGIGGSENIALAEKLAEKLGGMLASSRPIVDSGILPYARQVGQTGKTVSPKLYLALGISGAVQHMAGVSSRTLVSVNTDPEAPICEYADYVIRCDCGDFLRAMLSLPAGKIRLA